MDEENFFWNAPQDVPADTQADGAVTEDYTGEQVASEAGNAAWWNENYPGQTQTDPAPVINESLAETARLAQQNQIANGIPIDVSSDTANLPVIPASTVFNGAVTTGPATPTQDAYGLNILNAAQTQQLTRNVNPLFINGLVDPTVLQTQAGIKTVNNSATPVNTGAAAAIAAANQQIIAEAARLDSFSEVPNPYLAAINDSAVEIANGRRGIVTATQTIQSAQQIIVDNESILAQNNAELANPDISADRRAVLEANNAEVVQNIFVQSQSIDENTAYIASTQDIIQQNEAAIDINSVNYRVTSDAVSTTVNTNADPGLSIVDRVRALFSGQPTRNAAPVDTATANLTTVATNVVGNATTNVTGAEASAIQAQVGRQLAQQQAVNAAQKKSINNGDWRVRLSLAPGARYLYNDPTGPGILQPLAVTGGVIFPYLPKIETSYKADYDSYALTHSNYKGYFYKSSYTDAVNMQATFTAQDSNEADYLLAVIHFFKSVTKMFYGQDPQRGAPPPLVYLSGLGQYQFAAHPCVVTSFNYNLPNDVDYIRARSTNINGTNMLTRRNRQDLPTNPIAGAIARLQSLRTGQGISYGAEVSRPAPPTLGQNQPTYVPTRMEMSISLLPVQSRQQVSRVFSLQKYANGDLLKGGFW